MEQYTADTEAVITALDECDAAWDKLASLPVSALGAGRVLAVLERLELYRRRQPVVEHALINHLQSQATAKEMGAKSWRAVLSQRLGISGADAGRRLADAAALGPRRAVTGESLPPLLPVTAAAQVRGQIGAEHVAIVREFHDQLPAAVDPDTRAAAEAQLGELAGGLTPEGLRQVARQLMGYLDSDGTLDDERAHARKRGLILGRQELDGMSRLCGWADPALRSALEAILAKLAAPGYCNPADADPCIGATPSQDQISADTRTGAQRTHDALHTVCRAMLASGDLGRHNGLAVTIVATATLADLTAGTGHARTFGGSRLPIPTLIRQAAYAHPYLLLLGHNPTQIRLYYGRTRRTASPGQRLALGSLELGCTKPNCTTPATDCQAHHAVTDWQHGGLTDIDHLTLACGRDNRLVEDTPTAWTTRKRANDNRTEWIPPPHLDRGQCRVNDYHHPQRLLRPETDEPNDKPG
ncbi:MAG: HNH endonuclease [Mycobacterium sp.]|nr:HNH endonuclease [Mycobacterium sp.]